MATIDDIRVEPWMEARLGWGGELISADGASIEDFRRCDVADVLQYAKTGPSWKGETAGVIRLKDGRFVAWEAGWGFTGNGFVCEAYISTADLIFGHSQAAVLNRLSERARNLLIDYGM